MTDWRDDWAEVKNTLPLAGMIFGLSALLVGGFVAAAGLLIWILNV